MNQATLGTEQDRHLETRLADLRNLSRERLLRHPLILGLLSGQPLIDIYASYLLNVFHYATHSAIVIGMAGARCVSKAPEVAKYLLHHATEEVGHEHWAKSDLQNVGVSGEAIQCSRPSPSCLAMIGMEYYWAVHANPVALLGWMYTLEGFGDDIGHLVASKIGEQLKASQGGTYFLQAHGDADHDHIQDITRVIANAVSPQDVDDVFYVADMSCHYYLGMLTEIAEAAVHR